MSLYQCEKCGCVENSAKGHYHCRSSERMWSKEYLNKLLCSACGPTQYKSGEKTEYGKWHGIFRRRYFPLGSLYTEKLGNVRFIGNDKHTNKQDEL